VQNYSGMVNIYSSQFGDSTVTFSGEGTNSPSGGYHVCGDVSGTWNYNLIYVDCDIQVPEYNTLIINPSSGGTDIIFTGHYKFSVRGRIVINGTSEDSVRFNAQNSSTGWYGLRFYDTTWNEMDSSKVAYCSFKNGKANGTDWDGFGGGLFIYESSPVSVENCLFENNSATDSGGGIHIRYATPVIKNCTFRHNTAQNGGGVQLAGSDSNIQYCIFENNSSNYGGALYIDNGTPHITKCVIYGNTASSGTAFYFNSGNAIVTNCTMSGNNSSGNTGIIVLYNWSYPSLENSILWDESSIEINVLENGGGIAVTYSDIYGGYTGTGNINSDPLFVASNDFNLSSASPCIDAGNPASAYDPDGTICDMGGIYYNQTPLSSPANIQISLTTNTLTLSWNAVIGAKSYKVYSSDNITSGFAIDNTGTFNEETWTTSITNSKKFYYVTALN